MGNAGLNIKYKQSKQSKASRKQTYSICSGFDLNKSHFKTHQFYNARNNDKGTLVYGLNSKQVVFEVAQSSLCPPRCHSRKNE